MLKIIDKIIEKSESFRIKHNINKNLYLYILTILLFANDSLFLTPTLLSKGYEEANFIHSFFISQIGFSYNFLIFPFAVMGLLSLNSLFLIIIKKTENIDKIKDVSKFTLRAQYLAAFALFSVTFICNINNINILIHS